MSPPPQVVRIGLLSTAAICDAIMGDMKGTPFATVTAIASRDKEKATLKAKQYGIPHAYTYEELLDNTDKVDAVYIPVPTSIRHEWGIKFAKKGIHVLVEKPFKNSESVKQLIQAMNEYQIICLDGTHFVHSSRTKQIKKSIEKDKEDIKLFESSFHAPVCQLDDNIRGNVDLEPMGALGDLGWYSVRSFISILNLSTTNIKIDSIQTTPKWTYCKSFNNYFLESICCILTFHDMDLTLMFSNMFRCNFLQNIQIIGAKTNMYIPDFVIPRGQTWAFDKVRQPHDRTTDIYYSVEQGVSNIDRDTDEFEIQFPRKKDIKVSESNGWTQVTMMIHEFCSMIVNHDMDKCNQWMNETLATMNLLDQIFENALQTKPQLDSDSN